LGRPTKYQDDFPLKAEKFAENGLDDKQISEQLGVSQYTFIEYKKKFPLFFESLKKGRGKSIELKTDLVEDAFFQRACGYKWIEQQAIKIKTINWIDNKKIETEEIKIIDIEKQVPPDTTAGIFWLANRRPDKWKSINKDSSNNSENWTNKIEIVGLNEDSV
jgi:hypothetical protein